MFCILQYFPLIGSMTITITETKPNEPEALPCSDHLWCGSSWLPLQPSTQLHQGLQLGLFPSLG